MTVDSKGRELFIVDNSVSGWTGLRYLEEWSSIAKAFDIATGYFEIGALLTLDGKWQELDKIRILMGTETTHRTRKAILEAVRAKALDRLDESIEEDKEPNPFLHGVPAILAALHSGQIECRVYDKDKFHAKAYITHAKLEVVGAQALVGSSNFTRPGLTKNVELNVQIQSAREVAQLQEWFETHWNEAREVTEVLIETISRHTHLYSPFDVYAKALQQFFRGHELTATEWDENRSRMFPNLDRYQKEAYWAVMKIARQHGGAFLCDGVGLGKTFVGLMLIERLILHEGKRVALLAPKAAKEGVWEPHLRRLLPHIGGVGGGGNRHAFMLLALATDQDLSGPPVDILEPDRNHFLRPKSKPGHQQQDCVVATANLSVAVARVDQAPDLVGLQMAYQGTRDWLGKPRNASRQVVPDPAGCEQEAEQAAQTHRLVVAAHPSRSRIGRIKESHNVIALDSVQVTGFRTKTEGQEASQNTLASRNGLQAESPLLAQPVSVRQAEFIKPAWLRRCRVRGWCHHTSIDEMFDEPSGASLPIPCRRKFNADVCCSSEAAALNLCTESIDDAPAIIDRLGGVAETAEVRWERVTMRCQPVSAVRH